MRNRLILAKAFGVVGLAALFVGPANVFCEQVAATPYIDRANWFQVSVPAGWETAKGQAGKPIALTVKNMAEQRVQLTLHIEPMKDLPELVGRDELIQKAKKLLIQQSSGVSPMTVKEVAGLPMTGVTADFDQSSEHLRITILMDPPRKRAFVWTASTPAELFQQYEAAFNAMARSTLPALSEN